MVSFFKCLGEHVNANVVRYRRAHCLYDFVVRQVYRLSKHLLLEELAHLRSQRSKLRRQLNGLSNSSGIVSNHLLGGLRLWNRVISLNFFLQRDDVLSLVSKRLVAADRLR